MFLNEEMDDTEDGTDEIDDDEGDTGAIGSAEESDAEGEYELTACALDGTPDDATADETPSYADPVDEVSGNPVVLLVSYGAGIS